MTTVTIPIIIRGEGDLSNGKGAREKMKAALKTKFNIRDTKKYYSDINTRALNGMEIITFNAMKDKEEVSHINKLYVDFLLDNLHFTPVVEHDEELQIFTIALNEIDMYGEGKSKEEAAEDLLKSIQEYINIYYNKLDLYTKVDPISKQLYMLKLARCNEDKEKIRETIGVSHAY